MNKRKTILHLIPNLGLGGAEKIVLSICQNINKDIYESVVAYWGDKEDLLEDFKMSGIRVVKLNFKSIFSLNSILTIIKLIKTESVDIIQTHFIDADLLGFFASIFTWKPLFCYIHSYPFPEKASHAIRYRNIYILAKRTICVSKIEKGHFISYTKVKGKKVTVVYNGINIDKFSKDLPLDEKESIKSSNGIPKERFIIGNVSRLVPEKGHECLIKGFAKVIKKYPQCHLLIVGEGPLKQDLTDLCEILEITPKVTFLGKRQDIPKLLNIMDVFVFPGTTEAMGIAVLEAMACGKPIIAANDGGIPELINNNEEGLLIEPRNSHLITNGIIYLLENPETAKKFSFNAKNKAKTFTIDKMINDLEKIYKK